MIGDRLNRRSRHIKLTRYHLSMNNNFGRMSDVVDKTNNRFFIYIEKSEAKGIFSGIGPDWLSTDEKHLCNPLLNLPVPFVDRKKS